MCLCELPITDYFRSECQLVSPNFATVPGAEFPIDTDAYRGTFYAGGLNLRYFLTVNIICISYLISMILILYFQ